MTRLRTVRAELPHAVILAAGNGKRMDSGRPKPLVPVLGCSLIERCIRTCVTVGVRRFVVVVGYRGEEVRAFVETIAQRLGVSVRCVHSKNWPMGNGASLMAAEDWVDNRRFLLLMADHIIDPDILRKLLADLPLSSEMRLAIDRDRQQVFDLDDATKIRCVNGQVEDIGKRLDEWDAVDTGAFLSSPAIFAALNKAHESGQHSLTHGIAALARRGLVHTVDVTGCRWIDVDTPNARAEAERMLLRSLDKGDRDGFVSAWINRPVSTRLSRFLARANVTPNQITIGSFFTTLIGSAFLALTGYAAHALGGVLIQAASIIDGCDGEIARLKGLVSPRGAWLDTMLDRYGDLAITLAIVVAYARQVPGPWPWIAGMVSATGFILVSYVTKEFSLQYKRAYPHDFLSRLKHRDLRVLVIAVGAVAGFPFAALIGVGVFSHVVVAWIMMRGWRVNPASTASSASTETPFLAEQVLVSPAGVSPSDLKPDVRQPESPVPAGVAMS